MNLLEETKFILKKYGIKADKSLGQNFLIDENVVDEIIYSANISKEDVIIEIGPGLGTLTNKLLEKAGKVIAVELDKRMINILNDRFSTNERFELINNDILKVNINEIIENNIKNDIKRAKIVANLPYYITTPIIMKLLEENLKIDSITVMIQKEVADRLVAIPGQKNTGAITYSIYYYAEANKVLEVLRNSFIPEPNVDSEVINLRIRNKPPVDVNNKELLFKIIKYAFMQRRKTLVNALESSGIFKNKEEIINILSTINIDEKIRGEALTLEQFTKIANFIVENK